MEGEHDAGARMNTGCRSLEHGRVHEYDEPVDSSTHAESSTTQTHDKGEEHPETLGTTGESPPEKGHDQDGKGKEKVNESNVVQIIITRDNDNGEKHHETPGTTTESLPKKGHDQDNTEGKEKVIEANMVQIIIARDKGKGKEKVNEANVVQYIVARDNDNGEEHPETPETTKESLPENGHDQDNAPSLNAASYAESSTAAQSRLTKGGGEIQAMVIERDPIFKHARSLVEKVKEKCFIHKVHSGLRVPLSAKHYRPVVLSIGPYHHGDPSVQDMEKHKVHYMQVLLDRQEEESMAKYIKALRNEKGESQALDCYVDTFKMNADSFGECVVLDGLFMIELFRRCMNPQDYGKDMQRDMLFNIAWFCPRLTRDMLLFENQIPLFVLRALFLLTEQTTEEGNFVPLMLGYFKFNGIQIPYHGGLTTLLDDIPHLLGLVYEALVSCKNQFSVPETAVQLNTKWKSLKSIIWTGLVRLIEKALLLKTAQQPSTEWRSCEFIRTAVALEQVGVTFLKAQEDDAAFYDIRFRHGVLSIPRLVVDDNTKSFFRNLVAYEQYSEKNRLHRIVDYMHVMDCLINTGKDVELLRHCGIIDNRVGDDENVSAMFNYLCSNVSFDQDQFFYSKMFKDVNEFCMDRRNVWMAKLKNEYFGSPFSVISFLAAVLLLLLAALQTGYTVASYYK